ncbi:MAG TPA: hypothetical protein VKI65_07270, partial [Gemmataceae bacterium]|nr:hypothetical protein [Gemmataceae bacterium]
DEQNVPFLKKQLRPAASGDSKRIAQLLAQLDSDEFASREKATQALLALGEQAESALRIALAGETSLEVRRRVEMILEQLEPSKSAVRLREFRAVEVLEHIGTPEAKQLLQALAKGAPEARLTQEAKAALERLGRHNARK